MEEAAPDEQQQTRICVENSYITVPEGYGENHLIKPEKVQRIIEDVLSERLTGQSYDPVKGAQRAKGMAEEVKERVTLGQRKGQALWVSSRCLWDTQTDGAASATFANESLYCVCQVYGLYVE